MMQPRGVLALLVALMAGGLAVASAQSPPVTPPSAPGGFTVVHVAQQHVTFGWAVPQSGPPDHYVIEGGLTPGTTIASAIIEGNATTAVFQLPPGRYFLRLRAVRAGLVSDPSAEVPLAVGQSAPPSPPAEVAGAAIGPDVVLQWRTTYAGGAPADIVLDVSGAASARFVLPDTGRAAFPDVPPGVYTLTLRARNALGESAPGGVVVLSLPGGGFRVEPASPDSPDAPRLPVRHENFLTPRLAELLAREQLTDVVDGASTEFERILRLKDWVAVQWWAGNPDPYPPWDALIVLDWIRAGLTSGFCAQYSQVFVQSLAALGIEARYVELGSVDNPYTHYTSEVWSNDFNKWVLLDVYFNLHFERNGIPQSALEIHDAYVRGQADQLALVRGTYRPGDPSPVGFPYHTAEFYYYVRYHLKADHMTVPDEEPFDRFGDMIEWHDSLTVPWEDSTVPSPWPHERLTRDATTDRALVERGPNAVWADAERLVPFTYAVTLRHAVAQLLGFEYRVVDRAGQATGWTFTGEPYLVWSPGLDDRRLEVRAVNIRGVAGPSTALALPLP